MNHIQLFLEDDELLLLRSSVKLIQMFDLDMDQGSKELTDSYCTKISDATNMLSPEWRKEIGNTQRAIRALPQEVKDRFKSEIMRYMSELQIMMEKQRKEKGEF